MQLVLASHCPADVSFPERVEAAADPGFAGLDLDRQPPPELDRHLRTGERFRVSRPQALHSPGAAESRPDPVGLPADAETFLHNTANHRRLSRDGEFDLRRRVSVLNHPTTAKETS